MSGKFSIYLSHSWHAHDVDLNVWVWERLARRCELLVDKPESQTNEPSYYINRLEEAIRRSDIFAAVLTHRSDNDPHKPDPATQASDESGKKLTGDYALRCSVWSLFEIRLAERANRPRLVLYERDTQFRRPDFDQSLAKYIPFKRGTELLPEALDHIEREISSWLDQVESCRKPGFLEVSDRCLILLPEPTQKALLNDVQAAIEQASYERVKYVPFRTMSDAGLVSQIRAAGLLVADVTSESIREAYAITHALFIPTIRLASNDGSLPWILDGHPGGYQLDLIRVNENPKWAEEITKRASAMFRITRPLEFEEGKRYLKSRRYKGVYVFLSHNLKPGRREILDHLVKLLEDAQIEYYEYYRVNKAGEDWPRKLKEALTNATLFVGMLADGYEDSDVCLDEWEAAATRNTPMLAFLVNGRTTRPNLTREHAQTLDRSDQAENAEVVFRRILEKIAEQLETG